MRISKRQLKRIIKEEYSKLKKQRLLREGMEFYAQDVLDLIDVFEDDGLDDDEIVEELHSEGVEQEDAEAALQMVLEYGPLYGPVRILKLFLGME